MSGSTLHSGIKAHTAAARIAADLRCAELARCQHGVLTLAQLLACGLTEAAIRHRVRHGWLRRLHRGVYALGPETTQLGVEHAAVLACGAGAFVAGLSASHLRRLLPRSSQLGEIEVGALGRCPSARPGIQPRRLTRLTRSEIGMVDDIPVLGVPRTLLAVAALGPDHLDRAFDEAVFRRRAVVHECARLCTRLRGASGVPALSELVAAEIGGRRSRLEGEKRLLKLVKAAKLPLPEINGRFGRFRIDLIWREQTVAVEMDGFETHSRRSSFEDDRSRDAELQARGYRVLRVTWRQLTREPAVVIARLAAILALGGV